MNRDFTAPAIIKETSSGVLMYGLPEDMLVRRELALVGDIDQEGSFKLCQYIRYLDKTDATQPITLFIDSDGGEVSAGLAIYDVMTLARCRVNTVCMGRASAMGAILFIAGVERVLYPHAEVIVQDPLSPNAGGNALSVMEQSQRLLREREKAAKIIVRHSGLTLDEVYEMTGKGACLTAQEAVEKGFADYIVGK